MAGAGSGLGMIAATVPAWLAWQHLGGRTCDILGAVEKAFEIGCLLALSIIVSL